MIYRKTYATAQLMSQLDDAPDQTALSLMAGFFASVYIIPTAAFSIAENGDRTYFRGSTYYWPPTLPIKNLIASFNYPETITIESFLDFKLEFDRTFLMPTSQFNSMGFQDAYDHQRLYLEFYTPEIVNIADCAYWKNVYGDQWQLQPIEYRKSSFTPPASVSVDEEYYFPYLFNS